MEAATCQESASVCRDVMAVQIQHLARKDAQPRSSNLWVHVTGTDSESCFLLLYRGISKPKKEKSPNG